MSEEDAPYLGERRSPLIPDIHKWIHTIAIVIGGIIAVGVLLYGIKETRSDLDIVEHKIEMSFPVFKESAHRMDLLTQIVDSHIKETALSEQYKREDFKDFMKKFDQFLKVQTDLARSVSNLSITQDNIQEDQNSMQEAQKEMQKDINEIKERGK